MLSTDDIHAIAQEVVRLLRVQPVDGDVRFSKAEAAKYLEVSPSTFDRLRSGEKLLRPVSESPLRWSRAVLDQYKTRQRRELMQAAS